MSKKGMSVTIDEDVIEKIMVVAEKQDRSVSNVMNRTLREFLENPTLSGTKVDLRKIAESIVTGYFDSSEEDDIIEVIDILNQGLGR